MYGIDAFNAIINTPQAAILAVGRMAKRVIPLNGQPAIEPVMMLTLSCDHRVVDGARGAQFLAMSHEDLWSEACVRPPVLFEGLFVSEIFYCFLT
jgi:pyruvate/2-oxoglutarate dehydrogenase complex dihydrolipoamide acyltransferase (E2) component